MAGGTERVLGKDRADTGIFLFHPVPGRILYLTNAKTEIRESYWCLKKNSIIDLSTGEISDIALLPCRKNECVVWRGGLCIHIRKAEARQSTGLQQNPMKQ